jgi:CHAT domain-containing protein
LMSLWPVSDRSTRDLMIGYYKQLTHGEGRGEALRRAQLGMLRDSRHQHPYYWAAFILSGEWADLNGKR